MQPSRIVIALGGNAIARAEDAGPKAQQAAVEAAMEGVAELLCAGHEVAITHGNGPQVGNLLLKNELARRVGSAVPLDWCVAQTLFPHDVIHIENLGGAIEEVLDRRITFGCFSWRFQGDEAAFCRAVAFPELAVDEGRS